MSAKEEVRPGDTIATGFPSVDKVLGGGIRRGDLVVLGGDVGSGKSALALSMASRAARSSVNGGATFFSTEMRPERVRERLIAMERRVSIRDLRAARDTDDLRDSGDSESARDGEPLIRMVAPGSGADSIVDEIRSSFDIHLAVVDHLQSLATDKRALDEELAASVRKLKSAALESGTAVLLVAHCITNRDSGAIARPTLQDFGALGSVRQHADIVLAVFREEMYEQVRGIDGAAELHILKNRHGTTGYVDLYFYKQWLRFEDMVEPGDDQLPVL